MWCFASIVLPKERKEQLVDERNIEDAYTTKGFMSWKKVPQVLKKINRHIADAFT